MKKTIPFNLFGDNQYLYFDILRLSELEVATGTPMSSFLQSQDTGINFCLAGLQIGLKHHYHKADRLFFAKKIEEHLENGGRLVDISEPIIKAVLVTNIYGKELADRAMGKTEKTEDSEGEEPSEEPGKNE